jgi:hypothetical protein
MNWAFVDYENTGSLKAIDLSSYERVLVFCGPNKRTIKFEALPSHRFCRIELIGLASTGSNNLDFHLAFHLGRFHEIAPPEVPFHIVTNDTGFEGLVTHLKELGRPCKLVASIPKPKPKAKPPAEATRPVELLSLGAAARDIATKLARIADLSRPKSKAKLLSWTAASLNGHSATADPAAIIAELTEAKLIELSGPMPAYNLSAAPRH